MSTLANSLSTDSVDAAIIIPSKPIASTVPFQKLSNDISSFQLKLASLGVAPGDAISMALPNSYEFIVSFLATTWQRCIAAPLNPAYKQHEFEFYVADLNSTIVLIPRGSYQQNGPAVRASQKLDVAIAECYWDGNEVVLSMKELGKLSTRAGCKVETPEPDDIALVLHTSGTTSRPKAVPLTHRNLTQTMRNIKTTYQLSSSDRTLIVMPLFHVHGLLGALLSPLSSGGSVIVPPKFSASEFWADFIAHKANWYTGVPTIHQILLRSPRPDNIPKIRFIRSCSSPLSPKTFHDLESTFEAPVLEAYAMTEAAHQVCSNPLPPGKRVPGSVGFGQGVEVKILNEEGNEVPHDHEGEVCIRGDNVNKGYLNNPIANEAAFTKDGFFRTGDRGQKTADGYVCLTGRIKELINKGGEKISPVELDNTLANHPNIAEVVSFAIPDPGHYGEDIGIAVVPKDPQTMTEESLKLWMANKVAYFKVPKKIWIVREIPKTATGKVQRLKVAQEMLMNELVHSDNGVKSQLLDQANPPSHVSPVAVDNMRDKACVF